MKSDIKRKTNVYCNRAERGKVHNWEGVNHLIRMHCVKYQNLLKDGQFKLSAKKNEEKV